MHRAYRPERIATGAKVELVGPARASGPNIHSGNKFARPALSTDHHGVHLPRRILARYRCGAHGVRRALYAKGPATSVRAIEFP